MMKLPVVATILLIVATKATADECYEIGLSPYFSDLTASGWKVERSDKLFCGDGAPDSVRCQCNYVWKCSSLVVDGDSSQRDVGVCICCSSWVEGVVALSFLVACGCILSVLYITLCKGKIWCDGHRAPVLPTRPRVLQPVMIPSNLPLPPNLFRGFQSEDFVNGVPHVVTQQQA
eukprot:PhF_6_TR41653/c0_g1_i2/m.63146